MLKRKPKKRRIPNPLKASTRSAVKKGPARDKAHLAKVRKRLCLVCKLGLKVRQTTPTHAHHCRALNGGMIGVRPSDYLAVPLCAEHHLDQFPQTGLHAIGEAKFWAIAKAAYGIDPAEWISRFSPEGAAEIAALNGAASKSA